VHDSPELLYRLGQMLHHARLAPGLHVVEYGAGTGWLSGALWQMGCRVTCVDPSEAALALARQSFEERRPIAARPALPIDTAVTDGRTLPLADGVADRIVCHDAFHHIPNQDDILREFHRVLRPGGLACFCEPGRYHSATRHSQDEMRNFRVLENDIVLEDIWRRASAAGFTGITIRPVLAISYAVAMPRYLALVRKGRVGFGGREALMNGTTSDSIFFLEKGPFRFDSRFANRLGGAVRLSPHAVEAAAGAPVRVAVSCTNTGRATWLADAHDADGLGTVRVGVQMCDADGRLRDRDWRRLALPRDVPPGDTVLVPAEMLWSEPGRFALRFDLVSEGVAWFEADASPALLPVTVA
jgi:SAM-dependent methyltransferase